MMQGALRQRANKKAADGALLPIISTDIDNKKRRREWRRKTRRQQPVQKGQTLVITVGSYIVAFAIIGLLLQRLKRIHNAKIQYDFQCLNSKLKGVLNDDYCDCPDGSDEPLTSACSHILVGRRLFSCTAKTSTGEAMQLFPSRIQDGVVDCHDGSDEKRMRKHKTIV
jgi:hypothetical protein